jgi:hypothetical protein
MNLTLIFILKIRGNSFTGWFHLTACLECDNVNRQGYQWPMYCISTCLTQPSFISWSTSLSMYVVFFIHFSYVCSLINCSYDFDGHFEKATNVKESERSFKNHHSAFTFLGLCSWPHEARARSSFSCCCSVKNLRKNRAITKIGLRAKD